MKALLRWVGGKTWLREKLGELPPIATYHEPFFGSGKLYFSELAAERAFINDSNVRLMHCYDLVMRKPAEIAQRLEHAPTGKDYFLLMREAYASLDEVDRATWMIVMNCLAFNGLYRMNAKGHCNAPYGSPPKPYPTRERLLEVSRYMNETLPTRVLSEDFVSALKHVRAGDLVYMDPPYAGKFVGYQPQRWSEADAKRVGHEAHRLASLGASVIVTCPFDELHEAIFTPIGLERQVVEVRGRVSCKANDRRSMQECVYTTWKVGS